MDKINNGKTKITSFAQNLKQGFLKGARYVKRAFYNLFDIAEVAKDTLESSSQDGITPKRALAGIKRRLNWFLARSSDETESDFSDTRVIKYDSGYRRGQRRARKRAQSNAALPTKTNEGENSSAVSVLKHPLAQSSDGSKIESKEKNTRSARGESKNIPVIRREFYADSADKPSDAVPQTKQKRPREKRERKKPNKQEIKNILKSKKRLIACVAALIVLIILLTVFLTVVFEIDRDKNVPLAVLDTYYDLTLEFNAAASAFTLNEEVMLTNHSAEDWDRIVFRLYPNAFSSSGGKIDILSVQIDRQNTYYEISGVDKTVLSVFSDIEAGDTVSVRILSEVTLPVQDDRLGVTSLDSINLSCFYPALSVFENGEWRADAYTQIGDPFFSSSANFYVTVIMPSDFVVASSGYIEESVTQNGITRTEITAENIRDFGMAASRDFKILKETVALQSKSVELSYYYIASQDTAAPASANLAGSALFSCAPSESVNSKLDAIFAPAGSAAPAPTAAQAALSEAANAIKIFSNAFGEYPHSSYTLAETPIRSGGMEYGSFAIISPSRSLSALKETVIHETAHQWWYNAVGSDQINSAWLDEGLTQFCTGYYFKLANNNSAYQAYFSIIEQNLALYTSMPNRSADFSLNRPLSSFETDGEYVALSYLRGAMIFDTLFKLCGQEKLSAALKNYYADNKFAIASENELIAAFEKAGVKAGGIINGWVNGKVR
jgi:hypothetical protein